MNNNQLAQFTINMHTRTVIGLLDAAERADTPARRAELMAMARDAVLEFKAGTWPMLMSAFTPSS